MKQIILAAVAATTLIASQGFARAANINLGFTKGAVAVGGSYEHGNSDANWGGYLFHQTEKDSANVNAVTALGGMYSIHVYKKSHVDVYVAPGFGLAMTDDAQGDSVTLLGPSMKIGAQMALSPKMRLGVERFIVTNWFSDDAAESAEFTTAVLSFDF